MASSELDEYFAGKADTYEVFQAVAAQIEKLGPAEPSAVGKQLQHGQQYGAETVCLVLDSSKRLR